MSRTATIVGVTSLLLATVSFVLAGYISYLFVLDILG